MSIVSSFFQNLREGRGKDAALCQAQRDFVANTPNQDFTHPYYWSTLVLIGDAKPIWHSGISLPIILGGAFALLVLLAFLWKYKGKS